MAEHNQKLTYTEAKDIAQTRPRISEILSDGCARAIGPHKQPGITQTELGGMIGVAQNTISGWGARDLIPYIKERHEKLLEIFGPDSLYAKYDPEKVLATEYFKGGMRTSYSDDSKAFLEGKFRSNLKPPTEFHDAEVPVSGVSGSGRLGRASAQERAAIRRARQHALSETLGQFKEYCDINKFKVESRLIVKNAEGKEEARPHHIVTDDFVVDYAPVYVTRAPYLKMPIINTKALVNRGLRLAASRQLWLKEHPDSNREFWLCFVLDDQEAFFNSKETPLDWEIEDLRTLNVYVVGGTDPADLFENWLMSRHPEDFAAYEDQLNHWPEDEDLDPV